jgi:hypothetical protein
LEEGEVSGISMDAIPSVRSEALEAIRPEEVIGASHGEAEAKRTR